MRVDTAKRRNVVAVLLALVVFVPPAFAQRGQTATVAGTVRDTSRAVLPDATVTAQSPQLIGGPQETVTDATGRYRFATLLPGTYEITVTLSGFKTVRQSGIELPAGIGVAIDFDLQVAPVAEQVQVEAPTPIDVRSSASPTVIGRQLLENLPLDRNVATYVNLAPGITNNVAFGGSYRANPFSLDGTAGNDPEYGAPLAVPNMNWIDQIQVIGIGANAEYGDYTGSRFNAVTRSGGNRLSGLVEYWTTRPSWTASNRGSLPATLAQRFKPIEILERWDTSQQVGGPILRDRLWYFSGFEYFENAQRPFSFASRPRTADEPAALTREAKLLAKLTAAPAGSVRLEGYVTYDNSKATNSNAGPNVRPDALALAQNPTYMTNVRVTWMLTDRMLLEGRIGTFRSHFTYDPVPPNSRSGPPGHFDIQTGVSSVNIGRHQDLVRHTGNGTIAVTRYAERFAGTHEMKGGLDVERGSQFSEAGFPGGALYFDRNGAPFQVQFWTGSTLRPVHWTTGAFLQDRWMVNERLTIEPGVRAALYRSSVPVDGFTLYNGGSVSPRIGAAWDLGTGHRTVLRAHYGWYHDPLVNSFYSHLDSNGCSAPTIIANVVGPDRFQEVFRFGGCRGRIDTDPDVKQSYVEEYAVGIERALGSRMSVRAQFVRRDFENLVGFVDIGPTTWTPVGVIDPGPDGRLGTADDGGPLTVFYNYRPQDAFLSLTNPPGAWRRYHGVQLIGTRRYADGWETEVSYSWSRTRGNVNNEFGSNAASGDLGTNGNWMNPNRLLFSGSATTQDYTHELKVLGTYTLSRVGGLRFSGIYRYASAQAWARGVEFDRVLTGLCCGFLPVEPIGSRRLAATNILDLRFDKSFRIGGVTAADVFNVNNQGIALAVDRKSGPNFGTPLAWSAPRTLRVGIKMLF